MLAQPWYRELFPAPRQRWVDDLSLTRERARAASPRPCCSCTARRTASCRCATASSALIEALPDVRGHVFGRCGHASPLEHTDEFNRLLTTFLETDR